MDNINILITEQEIKNRIKELGKEISKDYNGKNLVVLCMLKGAVHFFSDLTRELDSNVMIDFARLSSYRNGTESGAMELISNFTAKVENENILIVEDIVDSGKTLAYFIKLLQQKNPKSIKICALLDKKERREVPITVDYLGFDIPNKFVVGYGLDYAEKFRGLPFIGEIIDPSKL